VGVYDPILVATSIVIAIWVAFVALGISGAPRRRNPDVPDQQGSGPAP